MFVPAIPDAVAALLLGGALKLTVLLLCAWLAAFALRRGSSALRHHLWAAAILASLLLPLFMLLLPAWRSTILGTAAAAFTPSHASGSEPIPASLPGAVIHASVSSPASNAVALGILLVWLAGFACLALRLLAGFARLAWLSYQAQPILEDVSMREVLNLCDSLKIARSVRLLESRNPLAMPLTWGLLRPVVILPAGATNWPADRRLVVLSHELAHIARHDWFLQMCAELARALYWFHPLVWLAAAHLRHESERACDDAVLLSGVQPAHYAGQLLDLARTLKNPGRAWSTALAIARPTNLERRFAAMLNPSLNRRHLSVKSRLLIPLCALAVLLPLAALRLSAQNLSGKVTGSIHDPSGTAVANATIILSNHAANTIDMTTSDRDGNFVFKSLPAGDYEFQAAKPGFAVYKIPQVTLDPGRDFSQAVLLQVGSLTERVEVTANNSEKPVVTKNNGKLRLSVGGTVEAAHIVTKVQPIYPDSAKSAGITGTVILHAVIGVDGRPLSLHVMNSQIDPDLARSAVEAVSQWRYSPTLLNGDPIEVETKIEVVYTLQP